MSTASSHARLSRLLLFLHFDGGQLWLRHWYTFKLPVGCAYFIFDRRVDFWFLFLLLERSGSSRTRLWQKLFVGQLVLACHFYLTCRRT